MSNGNGHHWSKFSWRDWHADIALHPCSLAARGFWMELLCMMHEGSPVGYLANNGKQVTLRQMAANAYCSEKEAAKYLAELEEAGVFSRAEDGTIYCRRMVKDAAASAAGREHIAKRWNGAKPTDPPNRGANSKPNGEANSPPTSQAYRPPTRDPITKNLETDTELEGREEKKSKILILTSEGESNPASAREAEPSEACPEAPPLVSEAAEAAKIVAQSLGKSLRRPAYAQGKSARFSRETQADLMSLKRPKAAPLPPEILAAMPHRMRAQPPQFQRAA